MSLIRRFPKSPFSEPSRVTRYIQRRSRNDFENISMAANPRDRKAILEDLKASEEPEQLPIRERFTFTRPNRFTRDNNIYGWQFIEKIQDNIPFPQMRFLSSAIAPIWHSIEFEFDYANQIPNGYMALSPQGTILVQHNKQAALNEWFFFTQHLIYHIALGYLRPPDDCPDPDLWRLACEILINNQAGAPLFSQPEGFPRYSSFRLATLGKSGTLTIEKLMEVIDGSDAPQYKLWRSPAGIRTWDILDTSDQAIQRYRGMYALHQVKQLQPHAEIQRRYTESVITHAYHWVEAHFPLLSAATAEFTLDFDSAEALNIAIGAVSAINYTIFVNPNAQLTEMEWRWVLVHEILHVVLEHHKRLKDRNPLLWNVACDYVINNWLEQMGVGMRPQGTLYQEDYKGRDAESIYNELLENGGNDQVKVVSFRGEGLGDMLDIDPEYKPNVPSQGVRTFLRRNTARQMAQNAARKMLEDQSNGIQRGTLPGDLVEQLGLRSGLSQQVKVPEWKAELAEWFTIQFTPKPPRRSYQRLSRRQSAAPHIPLAGRAQLDFVSPTFGVVLDTSGSMNHELLQAGLAAVVAFSSRHDVTHVRLVMCDTRPYDEGFIPIETLKKPYTIRGRGGTVLQPAVELLQSARDFPESAPILIITDGAIDILTIEHEHAYLLPGNGKLPFEPQGPVFNILGERGEGNPFRRTRLPNPQQPSESPQPQATPVNDTFKKLLNKIKAL